MFRFILFIFCIHLSYSWFLENELPEGIVKPVNHIMHDVLHIGEDPVAKTHTKLNHKWPNAVVKFKPGTIQCPIDIPTSKVTHMNLSPLHLNIEACDQNRQAVTVENNGHTVEIRLIGENSVQLKLTGGPLRHDTHIFEQMHFHWGEHCKCGSENHLNHKCYSTEIHLVFYNSKYGSFDEASDKIDGLTVIAIFGSESGNVDNHEMDDFINDLRFIRKSHTKIERKFIREFGWFEDIINNQDWLAYPGSLTTDPYYESVTWIAFPETFSISREQLDKFRKLRTPNGSYMTSNDRRLQEFNDRPVVARMGEW